MDKSADHEIQAYVCHKYEIEPQSSHYKPLIDISSVLLAVEI